MQVIVMYRTLYSDDHNNNNIIIIIQNDNEQSLTYKIHFVGVLVPFLAHLSSFGFTDIRWGRSRNILCK